VHTANLQSLWIVRYRIDDLNIHTKLRKKHESSSRGNLLCLFLVQVREIQMKLNPRITQWNVNALAALQEACEAYLVHFFEDCQMAATFANRVTVMQKDMHFVMKLKGKSGM